MPRRIAGPCPASGCPNLAGQCEDHKRQREQARGTTARRGYGGKHRRLSEHERAKAVGQVCHFCGQVMQAGQPLALDHTPDRTGYRGVVHLTCNASDGASRGNAARRPGG